MRPNYRWGSFFSVTLAATLATMFPLGCDDSSDSGTTGRRVALGVRVTSDVASPFTTAAGWKVTMSKAALATGALYYFDGATIFSRGPRPRIWNLIGPRVAFAHPGHYVPGNARGQLLTPSSVNLLTGGDLGVGDGVTGVVRSATFTFGSPAAGPVASELGANVAVLEGTATKGAETRVFRAEIAPADVKDTKGQPQIEGCPFAETTIESDGTVTLEVKVTAWLDQVELDRIPASTDGKPVVLPQGIARNELVRGMKEGLGYAFSFAPR